MAETAGTAGTAMTRRRMLIAAAAGSAVAAGTLWTLPALAAGDGMAGDDTADDDMLVVERLIGMATTRSPRVHLDLPSVFPIGSNVPMSLAVDSAMTAADHVRSVRVFAPRNPIVEVVGFRFEPLISPARVSTRIRLAKPQHVVAVAEMSNGDMLSASRFVSVATDGCA